MMTSLSPRNEARCQAGCRKPALPRIAITILCAAAFTSRPVDAADPAPASAPPAATPAVSAGHSYHGETFNEGPRQRAVLMGNTGAVRFPITSPNPDVQKFIEQGIGQLHGFWYFEAERSFRQAATLDPKCAIAFWGMALANTNNEKRAKGFIAEAVKRKTGISERESLYIDALDAFLKVDTSKENDRDRQRKKERDRYEGYAKALERILYKFPDDIEAKALLGLQLWLNREHQSPITSHLAVDALLKDVLAVEPMHPCHHYRIHLWDYEKAELAVDSAARCGQAAPGIAHMWHMSGHIFSRLERYADAAWQQEASARVDHAYMMRDRVLPDQIHNYAHNNEWLVRDLSHVGRVREAIAVSRNLSDLPRHPTYNTLKNGKSAHFGRLRLFEELTRFELWDELIALCETTTLEPTDDPAQQLARLRYRGSALLRKGAIAGGLADIAAVERQLIRERGWSTGGELRPESVPLPTGEDGKAPAKSDDESKRDAAARPYELALDELRGHLAATRQEDQAALTLLARAGGVDSLYLAKLQLRAGKRDEALKEARSAVSSRKNQAQPLAGLIEILWQVGEQKEAGERFAELRELAPQADLSVPPLARLAPIATALGYPADWRIAKPVPADVGDRPPLDSLGPLLWSPAPAPEWALTDAAGQEFSLSQYRGRPLVLLFYLGAECLHCAEQLQKFAPMTKEFADAGISLLAVSTDDRNGLQRSLAKYNGGLFPFPLVSNPTLEIFKAYRAFDDFENKPLHGTFFIDGNGLLRWLDVSHEPFQDPRFLLDEARRLLSLPRP